MLCDLEDLGQNEEFDVTKYPRKVTKKAAREESRQLITSFLILFLATLVCVVNRRKNDGMNEYLLLQRPEKGRYLMLIYLTCGRPSCRSLGVSFLGSC